MRKTVMIVNGSGNFRTVVKLILQNAGYAVVEAVDGKHAVSKLMGQKLNLIVCEANLPNLDGLRFLRHVKGTSACKSTPVIALTTESQAQKKGRRPGRRRPCLDDQAGPAFDPDRCGGQTVPLSPGHRHWALRRGLTPPPQLPRNPPP